MPPYTATLTDSPKKTSKEMADVGITNNSSEQRLMDQERLSGIIQLSNTRKILIVVVLCYVNLINYMDRYTVAGILPDIQETFGINSAQAGLLQTAFILVYMVAAPTYGYLGDRFNRKYLMSFGVFFWSLTTLIGSFMPNYESFLVFRCLVGVGEASYSTIAPTIISDMFLDEQRSKMLAFFYFAIPVGSGMGYMIGALVTELAKMVSDNPEAWRWGLRVTPLMGLLAVILILWLVIEPPRGAAEGGQHLQSTSFTSDLKYLATNKSYVLNTIAFTCVTFVAGALAWWGPTFVKLGVEVQPSPNVNDKTVSLVFGAIAMLAGLVGVPLGSGVGAVLRRRWGYADPFVCGTGLLISLPLLMVGMWICDVNTLAAYFIVFFGQVFLNLNWAVVSDIVLYTVIPTRRSSAEAFQILISHAFGDAGSPYLIGVMSDAIKPMFENRTYNETFLNTAAVSVKDMATGLLDTVSTTIIPTTPQPDNKYADFLALQVSMYACCLVLIFGAIFFYLNCCFIVKDKEKVDRIIADATADNNSTDSSNVDDDSTREGLLPRNHYAGEPPHPSLLPPVVISAADLAAEQTTRLLNV